MLGTFTKQLLAKHVQLVFYKNSHYPQTTWECSLLQHSDVNCLNEMDHRDWLYLGNTFTASFFTVNKMALFVELFSTVISLVIRDYSCVYSGLCYFGTVVCLAQLSGWACWLQKSFQFTLFTVWFLWATDQQTLRRENYKKIVSGAYVEWKKYTVLHIILKGKI